ncbi:MAG: alpha/beta hydrolase [Candidatus Omnitrophota bacterium]
MGYIFVAILVVIFLVFYVRWFEKGNIYFPYRGIESTPASIGLSYEDVFIETKDNVKLNGWFIPAEGRSRATLLYLHGNAGNISHRLEIIRIFHDMGLNMFIIDYRGYGKSGGTPSEKGTYLDALAAYEYITGRGDVDKENIIIYGKSLGGAIAIDLAAKADAKAVIFESVFTSIADIGQEVYPFLPIRLFNTIKYDNKSKVESIAMPKLVIHSRDDEIVPFHHGKKVFESAAGPKEFYEMRGGHNEGIVVYRNEFMERFDEYLKGIGI